MKMCIELQKTLSKMKGTNETKHFVLVHGACHGAWCWYKLKPRLESAGLRVTALDLSASGIQMKAIQEFPKMSDYSKPLLDLMESITPNEKVVLVGHSLGGLSLALAMEQFPHKISVAIFFAAFMPDTIHHPSYVIDKFVQVVAKELWLDTEFVSYETSKGPFTSMFFGPKFMSCNLYQLSSVEDLELAKTLVRPGSLFLEDLAKENKFSENGYGSVQRIYVVCNEDKAIMEAYQRWMIQNYEPTEIVEIPGADHMAMLSKPQQVCDSLLQIAHKYP